MTLPSPAYKEPSGCSPAATAAYAAVIGIDLAILLTRQEKTAEAARLAREAIPWKTTSTVDGSVCARHFLKIENKISQL